MSDTNDTPQQADTTMQESTAPDTPAVQITLNNQPVSPEQLQEEWGNLKRNERIVEKNPGEFRKIHRMQE
jgi:hypothetical protein